MEEAIALRIGDVARLMRRRFDERARAIGVTRQQWQVLTKLARHEGINQGKLADLLEVEPITLCRMVDRLAEAGHVERRRDPADRRAWNIYLTEASRPLLAQLRGIADSLFAAALDGLDEATQRSLAVSLDTIRGNLTNYHENEAANG